jgi:hypothetical protein
MNIKDLNYIRHSFQYRCCGKSCKNMKAVKAHEPNCKITSFVLNGGFYDAQENVFTTILKSIKSFKNTKKESYKINYLDEFKLTEKDLYYPYEIVYDFEARTNKLEYDDDKQLIIKTQHIPVKVSIN